MESVVLDVQEEKQKEPQYVYDYPERQRWILFIAISVISCLLGPPFMNWPPIRDMFAESGAFNGVCDNPNNMINVSCPVKTTRLENLGGNCSSLYYMAVIVCGLFLDTAGAKICSLVGLVFTAVGWIFVGASGPTFNGFQVGMYIVSLAVDSCFMGLVSVNNLFPNYCSTILGVLGASRSISFALPIIMKALFDATHSLKAVGFGMAGIYGLIALIVAWCIPYKTFPKLESEKPSRGLQDVDYISLKEYMKSPPDRNWDSIKKNLVSQLWDLTMYLKKPTYWLFVLIMSVTLIRSAYYVETTMQHLSDTESVYTIVSPLSFIPCPIIGYMFDKFSAALTCGFLALCGLVSLAVCLIAGKGPQYISIMTNWVFISFISSQCYCYIAKVYPLNVMGRLIGICLFIGGMLSLSSSEMNKFTKKAPNNLITIDIIVVLLGCISMIAAGILYFKLERPERQKSKDVA